MALQSAYTQMGWRYSFFPYALGVNTSGELVFYENAGILQGAQNEYWSFSTTQLHKKQSEVRVPSVSFDAVLEQMADGVCLPATPCTHAYLLRWISRARSLL